MNQRDATVGTIVSVLKERGVNYEMSGKTPVIDYLTAGDKATIRDILFAGFRKGQIEMSEEAKAKMTDDSELKKYVNGLVNNWTRKAPEFNCGGKYVAKNPGSRAGSGDDQVKEMKKLLGQVSDPDQKATIQAAIDARLAEIKPGTSVEIDSSKLPESLRYLAK